MSTAAWPDDALVISGVGVVSGAGEGKARLAEALFEGRTLIRRVERYDVRGYRSPLAALVPGTEHETMGHEPGEVPRRLFVRFGEAAGREALSEAKLDPGRVALVIGTNLEDHPYSIHALVRGVASALGIEGPCLGVSTACASATTALAHAVDLLRTTSLDALLVGGVDVLTPRVHAGFSRLEVLSAEPCSPFSEREGTSLGEGAGLFVVERAERARARGARIWTGIRGGATSFDAHHLTAPDPAGQGMTEAVRRALDDAGVESSAIGFVSAHATGTSANDAAEWRGISRALGRDDVPVSAMKSLLGHAQGAAGALELALTLLAAERESLAPTLGLESPRPGAPEDPVAAASPRRGTWTHALSTNAGFGGANAALVIGDSHSVTSSQPARRVAVRASGHIGPWGAGSEAPPRERPAEGEPDAATLEGLLRRNVRGLDLRGLDLTTRTMAVAVAQALDSAGLRRARDEVGLYAGLARASSESGEAMRASLRERGLSQVPGGVFARTLAISSVGTVAEALELRGPAACWMADGASALMAIGLAAQRLAHHPSPAPLAVASAAERRDIDGEDLAGAAALVLDLEGEVALRGFAWDAPSRRDSALQDALQGAHPARRVELEGVGASRGALESMLEVAGMVHELQPGEVGLVCAATDGLLCALALQRDAPR